uniref:Uncharacterized protein n=1 Tax=Romanomermis culicivorax TaxID=13658 RepID=A0A915L6P8_ROMCU
MDWIIGDMGKVGTALEDAQDWANPIVTTRFCEALYFNQTDVTAMKQGAGKMGNSAIRGYTDTNRRLL